MSRFIQFNSVQVTRQVMKAIQTSVDLYEKNTNLEKGPQVAFMEIIAELKDPGS